MLKPDQVKTATIEWAERAFSKATATLDLDTIAQAVMITDAILSDTMKKLIEQLPDAVVANATHAQMLDFAHIVLRAYTKDEVALSDDEIAALSERLKTAGAAKVDIAASPVIE